MSDKNEASSYPWAQLYDMESGGREIRRPSRGRGRPRNLTKRLTTTVSLTDDEKLLYEQLTFELVELLHPNKVFKSQVVGIALRLLQPHLKNLPRNVSSWEEVAQELFEKVENDG